MKTFIKSGQEMPYSASGADVESGSLVQVGTIVGVASGKILDGEEGELQTVGVHKVASPDALVLAQGVLVGYSVADNKVVAAGAGDFDCGTTHRPLAAGDDYAQVLLPLGPGSGHGY